MGVFSQVQVATITINDTISARNVPRFAIDFGIPFNVIGPYAPIVNESAFLETGFFITNKGFIYEFENSRFVHRTFGVSIPLRAGVIVNQNIYLGAGHIFNFPFHYKEKKFSAGGFKDKEIRVSEFFSSRVLPFYPALEVSAGMSFHRVGRFSLRLQTFYLDFFNVAFEENGVTPYSSILVENKLNFLISYNPGL